MVKISDYLVGIVIFMFIIVGGTVMISEFRNQDPTFISSNKYDEFNNTFNKLEDTDASIGAIRTNIEATDDDVGLFGVLNALILSSWQVLKNVFSSFSFMDSIFNGISSVFGVPDWIGGFIILLVTLVIAFAIYSAIFQREL